MIISQPQKKDKIKRTFNNDGVTLVEILISLTILVLVTGALSSGTNYLTRRLVRAKNAAVARSLAWKKLAEVKSRRIEPFRRSGVFGREFENYKYSEEIKPAIINGFVHSGLFAYELTVSWAEVWQEDRVTFSTLVADYLQAIDNIASTTEKNGAPQ
ncbi:MAG: type IV pilus modification PilV family protein [Candidatus Rifleibacteriota bacterium]